MARVLDILEVSQKQKYIFKSNKLRDNINGSQDIARITSGKYLEKIADDTTLFTEQNNVVYAGGGHTVLDFPDNESAKKFNSVVTAHMLKAYPGINLYAAIMSYDETSSPGDNLKELVKTLETKKAEKRAAFHQGTFGVEKIDRNTMLPISKPSQGSKKENSTDEQQLDRDLIPEGRRPVYRFEDIGGSEHESSFIAVVHIDGNAVGRRISDYYESAQNLEWDNFKTKVKAFSDRIDADYKDAYREMNRLVDDRIKQGALDALDLKNNYFPVRRIISSGDDVTFVTEGRIGIECAVAFIRALTKKTNKEDGRGYAACAGVAIVHRKFPFYKAYELAESLCANAKKFGASLSPDNQGADISSIDWHIEFGEMPDTLEDIRDDYKTRDGRRVELRPYIIEAPGKVLAQEPIRQYERFVKLFSQISKSADAYATGKLKQMRNVLKQGEKSAEYYLKFNKIDGLAMESYHGIFNEIDISGIGKGRGLTKKIFVSTADGEDRAILFDVIELLDTFIILS